MTEHALSALGAGIFVGILGILINEEGLADFIGTNALYVAVLTVCVGILEFRSSPANSEWYWFVFVIAVVAIAIRMIRGARRYESTSERNDTN